MLPQQFLGRPPKVVVLAGELDHLVPRVAETGGAIFIKL